MNTIKKEKNKQLKFWYWLVPLVFFVAFIALQFWQPELPVETIILRGEALEVAVPQTISGMHKGLGDRASIDPYDGMLFVFDVRAEHGIVMRNMQFPIDIVWFDGLTVVDIAPNVETEDVPEYALTVYRPRVPATMVLELQAGWGEKFGLKIGDVVGL